MKHSAADATFVTKATQGGMAEIELGRLAQQQASNEKVKQFGRQMETDHSVANDQLTSLATSKGMTIPKSVDPQSQATKGRLSKLSGAAFDRAYLQDMVQDHEQDIAEFQKEASSGTDPDIKNFASQTLPTLQHHLQMAQEALNELNKSTAQR